ncbi:MAG: DEAD/DEAH box helicase [Dehalococcoidia bacterium]|nr:DEAD/DEAH box helicase [Dehalococcoidia bacterium]
MPQTFQELGVPLEFINLLKKRSITVPTPIQHATIKDAMDGNDLCGRAPTGSGKTIAFGIPIITNIPKADSKKPTGLILAPTRELAEQITTELKEIARVGKRSIIAVYGGVSIRKHKMNLNKGVDILVACPGRLNDLLQQKALVLSDVSFVVVDEADRMADMGFLPEVKKILNLTKKDRQTILFSATLDGAISELTRQFQNNPIRHEVGPTTPDMQLMEHYFWKVNRDNRIPAAANLILQSGKTIVFTRTRYGAERASKQLKQSGIAAVSLHGGKTQNQRDRALHSFSDGQALALVCTDVAARGIHIDNVDCVLHYDPPEDSKAYIHRSGRTARAGASGIVVCFVDKVQHKYVQRIQRDLKINVPLTDIQDTTAIDPTKKAASFTEEPDTRHVSIHDRDKKTHDRDKKTHDRDKKTHDRDRRPRHKITHTSGKKKKFGVKKRKLANKKSLSNVLSRSRTGKVRKRRKLAEPRSKTNSFINTKDKKRRPVTNKRNKR